MSVAWHSMGRLLLGQGNNVINNFSCKDLSFHIIRSLYEPYGLT